MDSLVRQIEEQGPSFGVVISHYLHCFLGDQICGVATPGTVVHSGVPSEVIVSSSGVVEVGLSPGVETNKTIEPSLGRSEGLLAEAEMPLANYVSLVAQALQLVRQQASLQAQACRQQRLRRLSLHLCVIVYHDKNNKAVTGYLF